MERVLIVGNMEADGQYSMLGFSHWLYKALRAKGFDVQLIRPRCRLGPRRNTHRGAAKWLAYVDKFVLFPPELRRAARSADFVHIVDQGNALYGRHCGPRWGITVHDLLAARAARGEIEGWKVGPTGTWFQKLILQSLAAAEHVACDSQATRSDLLRLTSVPPSKVTLVPLGLLNPISRMSRHEAETILSRHSLSSLADCPFILHVGGNQPYKNRAGFLRIAAAIRREPGFDGFQFVAAGHPFDRELAELSEELGLGNRLVNPSGMPNEAITALYSTAQALIFPSLQEGFGLPVLEAMACGCPVFTSDRAPMTEVGGDAAAYFEPTPAEGAATAIAQEWHRKHEMAEKGKARADLYSQEGSAKAYAAWYRGALSG